MKEHALPIQGTPSQGGSPAHSSVGPDRLPLPARTDWSQAQQEAIDEVIAGPRGALIEPFRPMMRSPELMTHMQRAGAYLRYRSHLGLRLSEFVILIVAREWSQPVEWAIHAPIALREGVSADTIRDLSESRVPSAMPTDEAVVLRFCRELMTSKQVTDETWQSVVEQVGEDGVVDLLGLIGYYTTLAMVMNAARTPAPMGPTLPPMPATPGA